MLIFGSILLGCQGKPQKQITLVDPPTTRPAEAISGALAFTPPMARGQRELQLWRDDREAGAFAGYQETITEYYHQRTDDRQYIWDRDNHFMRRSVTGRIGVTYR